MPATISHLQLDTYFLKEISYSLNDNLDSIPEKITVFEPIGLEITDHTNPLDIDPQAWRCELTIESSGEEANKNPFYKFKIVMVGFFKVNPNLPSEQARILAETNCPAVLYSTSREVIATITRRSPYPVILLPLVTFIKGSGLPAVKGDDKPQPEPKTKRKTVKRKVADRVAHK